MPIKGISDLKNISLINVSGPGMKGMVGMAGRLFTAVSRAGISIVLITQSSSEFSISFCISTGDLMRARRVISEEFRLELKDGLIEPIEVTDGCSVISVVGDGMRTRCGTSGRFFRALAEANININAIAQGSSERSISAVISQDKVEEAIAVCHAAFFSSRQRLDLVILGVGVGSELISQIQKQRAKLRGEQGIDIHVVGIANSRHFLQNASGTDLDTFPEQLVRGQPPFSLQALGRLTSITATS